MSPRGLLSASQSWVPEHAYPREGLHGASPLGSVGHTGLWKPPRIPDSHSLGLGLDRTEETRGGTVPGAACQQYSLLGPGFFLLEITGLSCQMPAPASTVLTLGWACPLHPAWTRWWCDRAGVGHPFMEDCSQPAQCPAWAGLSPGSALTPALAITAGGSSGWLDLSLFRPRGD